MACDACAKDGSPDCNHQPSVADLYPEHAKLRKISDKSQAIGEFLDWAGRGSKGLTLCYSDGHRFYPSYKTKTKLLAEFFGIDEAKLEAEKLAMLEECRRLNERSA